MIFLDILLYSAGGVIGTMHHLYFSGEPAEHMALGAFFSAAEVIPLTFLTVEAWSFLQLGARQESRSKTPFPHRWAVMFLVAVGFWNFLGAGVFGFLINLPIVSYYEIGTALTANHGHAAMMGVYGMLAVGLALFCLRYLIPAERWSDRAAKISFWSLNIGLAWMCFADAAARSGSCSSTSRSARATFEARTLEFLTNSTNTLLEWLRFPGDVLFIVGGVLPLLYICWLGVRHRVGRVTLEEPEDILFTEMTGARAGGDGGGAVSAEALLAAAYAASLESAASSSTASPATPTSAPTASAPTASPITRNSTPGSAPRASTCTGRSRPRATLAPLPRPRRRLQRLSGQGRLHRLRRRPRDQPLAGPLAALGVGPLPSGDLGAPGRARRPRLPAGDAAQHGPLGASPARRVDCGVGAAGCQAGGRLLATGSGFPGGQALSRRVPSRG